MWYHISPALFSFQGAFFFPSSKTKKGRRMQFKKKYTQSKINISVPKIQKFTSKQLFHKFYEKILAAFHFC